MHVDSARNYRHTCTCPECAADITDFATDQFYATRAFEDYSHPVPCPECEELIAIVFRFEMGTEKLPPLAKARLQRWYDADGAGA